MKTKQTIRNCESIFRFQCPQLWEEMALTDQDAIRHCEVCNRDVFLCRTDDQTIEHAKAGHCIARELPDESELPRMYLGEPRNVPTPTPEQNRGLRWFHREAAIDDSIKNARSDRCCPLCNYPAPRWRVDCRVCGFKMGRRMSG